MAETLEDLNATAVSARHQRTTLTISFSHNMRVSLSAYLYKPAALSAVPVFMMKPEHSLKIVNLEPLLAGMRS